MLPKNRKEVFFDVFKLHFGKLLTCGLICLAFCLPLHISAIVSDIYELSLQAQFVQNQITAEQLTLQWLRYCNTRGIIEIFLCILFSTGLSSVARVIRQLAWEENVYMRFDLLKGVKQNIWQYALLGLLFGIVRFACNYFMNNFVASNGIPYVGIILTVVSIILFAPAAMFMIIAISIYGNKFGHNARLGFLLYVKHPFKTIAMFLVCIVVFIPQYIPMFNVSLCTVHIVFRIISSLLSGVILLIWFLFASYLLDKDINPKHHPDLIDRGVLGKKEK